MREHFVTVRLVYVEHGDGRRTPYKRVGKCTCGWTVMSWDPYRPIWYATEHVQTARRFAEIVMSA